MDFSKDLRGEVLCHIQAAEAVIVEEAAVVVAEVTVEAAIVEEAAVVVKTQADIKQLYQISRLKEVTHMLYIISVATLESCIRMIKIIIQK